jgi:hypothetical protein
LAYVGKSWCPCGEGLVVACAGCGEILMVGITGDTFCWHIALLMEPGNGGRP